jgi:hypothetical protein
MEESITRVVTLEIENGRVTRVLIDGEEPHELAQESRDAIFASENGPRYVSTILYHVDPVTSRAMICVHKNCVLVCR